MSERVGKETKDEQMRILADVELKQALVQRCGDRQECSFR